MAPHRATRRIDQWPRTSIPVAPTSANTQVSEEFEPALVPELLVCDIDRSLEFWYEICGFELRYSRPEERFAYIALCAAHLMLEQVGVGRNWFTAELEAPLSRDINFQVSIPDIDVMVKTLSKAGLELFMPRM